MAGQNDDDLDVDPVAGLVSNAEATVDMCSVSPSEQKAAALEPGVFEVQDEILDAFPCEPLFSPKGADGIPRVDMQPHDQGVPPPYTFDTVVCTEDDRTFVALWDDELGAVVTPAFLTWCGREKLELVILPRYDQKGGDRERISYPRERVEKACGISFVRDGSVRGAKWWQFGGPIPSVTVVRPVRPACKHYKLQVFANDGVPPGEFGHQDWHRNCAARRSIGGAYLGLSNQAVYGCSFRDPHDPVSFADISAADHAALESKRYLKMIPAFGGPGEERDIAIDDDPWTRGGIFGDRDR